MRHRDTHPTTKTSVMPTPALSQRSDSAGRNACVIFGSSDNTWGELYDFTDDPHEMVNRWSDPAFASIRADLTQRLTQEMLTFTETSPHPTNRA
jgi:hypothetical protein